MSRLPYATLGLLPALPLVLALGCTAEVAPDDTSPDASLLDPDQPDVSDLISDNAVIARAEEWVDAKLHYCQSPNHERDYDTACSATCERHDNPTWDPYRSDCSGFVSWAWGLGAPGRTTLGFAPFRNDITHAIEAIDLREGDAINNSDHIMLFKAWVHKGTEATFLEEPGCSSSTPYAHQVTVSVSIDHKSIYVPYNGMTFTAIRFDGITAQPAYTEESDRIGTASWGPHRLDLFSRDGKDHLHHRSFADGKWSAWRDLGGDLASAPAAASWGEGRIDVFARGKHDQLVHDWYADHAWHLGEDLGGELSSAPTVISRGDRSLDVFARGAHQHLVHKYFRPGTGWSGWEDLGGDLASAPTAAAWPSGEIFVFARAPQHDDLTRIHYLNGTWSAWTAMEGPISAGPAVSAWGPGRLDLFGNAPNGKLAHRWYTNGAWSDWQLLGGNLDSAPTVVSWGPSRIDVFGRGGDDHAAHKYWDGASWSEWSHQEELPQ